MAGAAINENAWRSVIDVMSARDEGVLAAVSRASKAHRSMAARHLNLRAREIVAKSSVVHAEPRLELSEQQRGLMERIVSQSRKFMQEVGLTAALEVPEFIALSLMVMSNAPEFVPSMVAQDYEMREFPMSIYMELPASWTDWSLVKTRHIVEFAKHYVRKTFGAPVLLEGAHADPAHYWAVFLMGIKALSMCLKRTRDKSRRLETFETAISPSRLRAVANAPVVAHIIGGHSEDDFRNLLRFYAEGHDMLQAIEGVLGIVYESSSAFFGEVRGPEVDSKKRMNLGGAINRTPDAFGLKIGMNNVRKLHDMQSFRHHSAHDAYFGLQDALQRHRSNQH